MQVLKKTENFAEKRTPGLLSGVTKEFFIQNRTVGIFFEFYKQKTY